MGLFFEILSAINDPNKQGTITQLEQIVNQLQTLSTQYEINSSMMESILSAFGSGLQPILNQQATTLKFNQIHEPNQTDFSNFSTYQVESLLPSSLQQQIIQQIARTTGLEIPTLQNIFPSLISATFNLFSMGKNLTGSPENNSILNTYLDSQKNEDFDLGKVFKFANRFLNPPTLLR